MRAVCRTCSTARPPYRLSCVGRTANGSVATVRTVVTAVRGLSCTEKKFDELFLEASQLLDVRATIQRFMVKPSGKQQVDVEPLDNPVVVKPSGKQKESRIQKTLQNTECMGSKRFA